MSKFTRDDLVRPSPSSVHPYIGIITRVQGNGYYDVLWSCNREPVNHIPEKLLRKLSPLEQLAMVGK